MNTLAREMRTAPWSANLLLPVKVLHAFFRWWRERREIERLSAFPDSMLKDIGLSRSGIDWAVRGGHRKRTRPASGTGSSKKMADL
jgi:uncharacterized protein YjiS (DUF1127 family)